MGRPSQPFYRKDRDIWIVRVNGKQITLAHGKGSKKAALEAFYKLMSGGGSCSTTTVTVQQVVDNCIAWTRKNREPLTTEGYERHAGSFARDYGTRPANLIKPTDVHSWMLSKEWGPVTRYNATTHLKRAFTLAVKHGLIPMSPLASMENPLPPVVDDELDEATIRKMFDSIKSARFLDLVTFCYETGCRVGEARTLEARHIQAGQGVATLIGKTTNATRRLRRIYLSDRAADILGRLAKDNPTGPLFRNKLGNPWTRFAVNCQMARIRGRAGLGHEVVIRMLRKHWITDALARGVPIATVAELAGHQTTRMIESVYSKLSQRHEHLRSALNIIRPSG